MNSYQQQILKQLKKIPDLPSVHYDSICSSIISFPEFLVYVDYHKRRGLQLSSSVFEFENSGPSAEMRAFLRSEFKKKKNCGSGLEWDGHDAIHFIQLYPKNIIDDDQLSQLSDAITSFHESIKGVRQKLIELQSSKATVSGVIEFLDQESQFDGGANQNSWNRNLNFRKDKEPAPTSTRDSFDDSSSLVSQGTDSGKRLFSFGRRKKTPEISFVPLDDGDVDSD